jgi:hypothetical protein
MVEGSGAPNNLLARASVGTTEAKWSQQAGYKPFSPTPGFICLSLTLLEPGWSRRNLLVGIYRRLRSQCVKLLPADHVHFLKVLDFLLHRMLKWVGEDISQQLL